MKQSIRALIYPEGGGFIVEIPDVNAYTQGDTLEQALSNAREAVTVALDGEDPSDFRLTPNPSLIVTIELGPLSHAV